MIQRINENQLSKEFDLIVIGGGINGCGIARDAAERGLKVLLLEKEDFGSGCTSASTRLIHGGLRYLEHYEFDLVRESLVERELLLKNANHLVSPLKLFIPVYKGDKRGPWLIKAGMLLYDFLSIGKSLPNHKIISRENFIKQEPGVNNKDLISAAEYYDAQVVFPERICLENILMARQNDALLLNHSKVINLELADNKILEIEFLDLLSQNKYKARGKIVLNASGPWVDSLCELMDRKIKQKISGTVGSHIFIRKFNGGPKNAIFALAKTDARPFFIVPWQGYYLIGTTDIPIEGEIDHLKISNSEINYLINEANNIFYPNKIAVDDIVFSYSGVRPLPFSIWNEMNPSKVTRRHIIFDHLEEGIDNFISIIGGKLTTYRNLSEIAVNLVYKKLNYKFVPCLTRTKPLLGNIDGEVEKYKKQEIKKVAKRHDIDPDILIHLINIYGKKYRSILDLSLKNQDLGRLLSSSSLDVRAQVVHAIQNELAYTISDILLRRTLLGLNEGLGKDAMPEVIKSLQLYLGLSNQDINKQISDYEDNVIKLRKIN